MRHAHVLIASMAICAVMGATSPSLAQAPRTWVSGVGDDANPCSRTAPCKTFAGAISKTTAGGEISVLDPGGFGAVTITKSISITNDGAGEAGILASGTNGIIIAAGASDIVNLRGLVVDGAGTGLVGIKFTSGAALLVQSCVIKNFRGGASIGIQFAPTVFAELYVNDSVIHANGTGVLVQPTSGSARTILNRVAVENNSNGVVANTTGSTGGGIAINLRETTSIGADNAGVSAVTPGATPPITMMLDHVSASMNGTGIFAQGAGSSVRLTYTTVTSNLTGLSATGANLLSYKTNQVDGNFSNGTFTSAIAQE